MSGIPKRKPCITKASRAEGEYSIGAPAKTPSPAVDTVPSLTVVKPQMPVQASVESSPSKPGITATTVPFIDTELTQDSLLATPTITTNISLDKSLNASIRRLRIELRRQGYRVTIGTLVSYAMASAFSHHTQWIHEVEPDARRSPSTGGADKEPKRRTSLNLPSGLPAAAEFLVWQMTENDSTHIPSMTSIQIAALRWGLSHQENWLPGLVSTIERPVRA